MNNGLPDATQRKRKQIKCRECSKKTEVYAVDMRTGEQLCMDCFRTRQRTRSQIRT